jgi:tRNA-binding EMAP/Myf-like protein
MIDDEPVASGSPPSDVELVPADETATVIDVTESLRLSVEQPPPDNELAPTTDGEVTYDDDANDDSEGGIDDRESTTSIGAKMQHTHRHQSNMKVQTLIDLADQLPAEVDTTGLRAEQPRPNRQLIAQVADAIFEVRALEFGPPPECEEDLAHAESWLSSLGETAREHKVHEIRLAVIRKKSDAPDAAKAAQVLTISLGNEAKTLEAFQRRIGRLAKFKVKPFSH